VTRDQVVHSRGVTAALVPVDASLVNLGDIMRGAWPKEFAQRNGTVFSFVMNDYSSAIYGVTALETATWGQS